MIKELYADGGVIGRNPSTIGGTYAYRLVMDDDRCFGTGGILTPDRTGGSVTNNQTEMLAVLTGLRQVPDDWAGTIYSDSMVTLGRLFLEWKWKNIPPWMHRLFTAQRTRLKHWDKIKWVLLDGHPTAAQLRDGVGKRGHLVSIHNVWCDQACKDAGAAYLKTNYVQQEFLVS